MTVCENLEGRILMFSLRKFETLALLKIKNININPQKYLKKEENAPVGIY